MAKYLEIMKNARMQQGFTQSVMGKKLGIGLRMYQKIEEGYLPKYKREHITNIDLILNTNIYELVYGEENKKKTNNHKHTNSKLIEIAVENFMEVSYLPAHAQAAYMRNYNTEKNETEKLLDNTLVPIENEQGVYMTIEVVGDSMDDDSKKSICDGDQLLIKELDRTYWDNKKLNYNNYIFVLFTKKAGIVCTHIIKHHTEKKTFTCQPRNELYKSFDILTKEVYRLFYVKKIVERKIRS